MKRQINAVLKNELKDILDEAVRLRDRVKEINCNNDCEGRESMLLCEETAFLWNWALA